ncbi:unnamed protein product [Rangifer tarandus platyrhynchus]|uniref:Uncharacterized protein n=1 Tax=Rangifer tarandus platyrhynchus TaxID=3082113 RepID=A0ABN8XLA5_RANTA|nr:unnamed protein product [Rangifer tarandus platyrhynchus]
MEEAIESLQQQLTARPTQQKMEALQRQLLHLRHPRDHAFLSYRWFYRCFLLLLLLHCRCPPAAVLLLPLLLIPLSRCRCFYCCCWRPGVAVAAVVALLLLSRYCRCCCCWCPADAAVAGALVLPLLLLLAVSRSSTAVPSSLPLFNAVANTTCCCLGAEEAADKRRNAWRCADSRSLMREDRRRFARARCCSSSGSRNDVHEKAQLLEDCCKALHCVDGRALLQQLQDFAECMRRRVPFLELSFEFLFLFVLGYPPWPPRPSPDAFSHADDLLSRLLQMRMAEAAMQAVRSRRQLLLLDGSSACVFEKEEADLVQRHLQQLRHLQQEQLRESSDNMSSSMLLATARAEAGSVRGGGGEQKRGRERAARQQQTLQLLQQQREELVALSQRRAAAEAAAMEEAHWRQHRETQENNRSSPKGDFSPELLLLPDVLKRRWPSCSLQQCLKNLSSFFSRSDALTLFFKELCHILQIDAPTATFAEVLQPTAFFKRQRTSPTSYHTAQTMLVLASSRLLPGHQRRRV